MNPVLTNPERHRYRSGRMRPENAAYPFLTNPKRTVRHRCRVCGRPKSQHPIRTKADLLQTMRR